MYLILQILVYAIVAAFSPLVIATTLTVLLSDRGRLNGTAFAVGFLLTQVIICLIGFLVGTAATSDPLEGQRTILAIVEIVLGAGLLAAAWREWKHPERHRERRPTPRIDELRTKLDLDTRLRHLRPGLALSAGALLAIGPKRLILTILAVAQIGVAHLLRIEEIALSGLFVIVASFPVLACVGIYLLAGNRAESMIAGARAWFAANTSVLRLYSTLVFGVLFIADGLVRLP